MFTGFLNMFTAYIPLLRLPFDQNQPESFMKKSFGSDMALELEQSKTKEDRDFVTALARGLDVLDCFRHGDQVLGNLEIAKRCNLPKSTVTRLTYTLTKQGYLVFVEESGKYRLGSATLALGSSMLAKFDIRRFARPYMEELAKDCNLSVALCSRDRLSMIYVENVRPPSAVTISLDVGARIPLAVTSAGRAFLVAATLHEREEVLERLKELDELAWPKIKAGINKAIVDYESLRCTTSFGEWHKDINAIAIPFSPGGGRDLVVINCGGPAFNTSADFLLNEVRPKLLDLGKKLGSQLGVQI